MSDNAAPFDETDQPSIVEQTLAEAKRAIDATKATSIPTLTEEQKEFVRKNYRMELKRLTQETFQNHLLDGRCFEAKAIKAFIAEMGMEAPQTSKKEKVDFELTPEQKEYIDNNRMAASGPQELARALFPNVNISIGCKEMRAVTAYYKQNNHLFDKADEAVEDADYKSPVNIMELVGKVNKYALTSKTESGALLNPHKLTQKDIKCLRALLSYMGMPLFKIGAEKFMRKVDRDLFESSFIAFCWNKPELPVEEVIDYINWSDEIVKYVQMDRTKQKLDQRLDDILAGDQKLNQAEVDLLNSFREKLNASRKQQSAYLDTLHGKKSARDKGRIDANASILNLVDAWKQEEHRAALLALVNLQQKADALEADTLMDMDGVMALISGITKEEAYRS